MFLIVLTNVLLFFYLVSRRKPAFHFSSISFSVTVDKISPRRQVRNIFIEDCGKRISFFSCHATRHSARRPLRLRCETGRPRREGEGAAPVAYTRERQTHDACAVASPPAAARAAQLSPAEVHRS